MKSGVASLLNAKRFVVFGATDKEEKPGYVIFRNLLNAGKEVFGVNIRGGNVLGQRIFKDVGEIAYQVDCAVIATPAKTVPVILRQIAKRKIKNAIVISSGFGEVGNKKFEEHLGNLAKELEINLMGPNSFGFINPYQKINTSFYSGKVSLGGISFISQSGAIGAGIIDKLKSFSGFVSVGNSVDLEFSDFIEYYSEDEKTKVICLYIESLEESEGKRFLDVCKKCKKPIIALKAGKTPSGKRAGRSHTAVITSEEGVYSGVFKQAGIIECSSIKEMFSVANVFENVENLESKACVVTNAGGLGVLVSDYLSENEVPIMKLESRLEKRLDKVLPYNWSHNNPIDILGDADFAREVDVFKILEKEKSFGFYVVLLTPQHMTEIKKSAKLLTMLRRPVFVCLLGGDKVDVAKNILDRENIFVFDDPKEMCEVIGKAI
ncbi:hypothetical protein CMI41_02230 [Candidatus Pacearchaeota archaeon]|jgi:acetyltransferase|nr:hypothetical protein [Candidatus Pacearchaeota archaeon]|tara:strand:- start:652 stop:1956 length:1305 start_codon:yes stop_codon:yes gene_type:complete